MKSLKAFAVPFFAIILSALVGAVVASAPPTAAQGGIPPIRNIELRDGPNSGEVVISWDAVSQATHYRIGYVNMEVDYHLAKASCTSEWIEAFIYVDVNARNIPVTNGRAEYTIRRLSPGARHAFTVLTSNSFVDSGSGGSVGSEFFWPSNPRWQFLPGRDSLPSGITLPTGECTDTTQPPSNGSVQADRAALDALYNATGGDNWSNNTNWRSDAPLGQWHGVTTDDAGRVTKIVLTKNGLTGTIPTQLGNLTNLETLALNVNQLTEAIPAQLGNLTNLEILALGHNQLTGTIPAQLGNLTNSEWWTLDSNELSGTIPAELGALTNLEMLDLSSNKLTGTIPAQLGTLTNLLSLNLRENQLTGTIPAELGSMTNLRELFLWGNQLTGCIPLVLRGIAVNDFNLLCSTFCGQQPPSNGNVQPDRAALDAFYNATGGSCWINNTNWLSDAPLGQWHGVITDDAGRVTHILLTENGLTGTIPAQLGNLTNLEILYLGSNKLTGTVPTQLSSLANLKQLHLFNNELSGTIPAELGALTNLRSLNLSRNRLTGAIPAQLGNLTNLLDLSLHSNHLTGTIPAQLGSLANLEYLSLNGNQLIGEIPAALGSLVNLMWLYLGGNQLTGCIPAAWGDANYNDLADVGLPFCNQ